MTTQTPDPVLQAIGFVVALIISLGIYFLPWIIGIQKRNATAIFVLNLLLGWTFIGWVAALVWACTKDPVTPPVLIPRRR